MKIKVHSNIGRRRSSNQDYADYFKNQHNQVLFVLCDGVGGHQAGDVASLKTTEFLGERFKNSAEKFTLTSIQTWLMEQITAVNEYIYQESIRHSQLGGMGTTLVVAMVVDGHLVVAHVGDSRAYVFANDALTQVTEDHSLINVLIKSGEITKEEGQLHPQRNVVTQSIGGTQTVGTDLTVLSLSDVEVLLLCSDGLTNMVDNDTLLEMFKVFRNDDDFPDKLIQAANDAGGTDNITVIVASDLDVTEVAS
ncbi:Stp1/IreP family PP2C-type Ser/Thr phosphatase [Aerococcaceae bacterium zg-ZJ1578]|uniref:Stp1/IreP family PP2C-type Ser/Thr phosphatase n=1 Tax=Aerococcaceae bacterium zg-252 TaxID=2796928 RepID=UPI001A1F542E|nr:Stp1/IreP family PP2C-type Ser/Thr phosphatase [Aerococcaceae bacterium zg-1578]MBS4461448.1 Stp1/IreP family PP2C-type Ser/Thr phosphatase [Aerococcaceae bacterium zg-B36]